MKKQPLHLIFLLKSNRLGLRMEGREDSCPGQADCPQCSLATKDGEARGRTLAVFSLLSSFPYSFTHSFIHL